MLPPPIERLRLSPIAIVVAEAWLEQSKFETKVDLPLPLRAAVQNLVLAILANQKAKRSLRAWCRTAGLNHKTRNMQLSRVVAQVSKWFEQHKGEAVRLVTKGGRAWFITLDPRWLDDEGGSTSQEAGVHVSGGNGSTSQEATGPRLRRQRVHVSGGNGSTSQGQMI